MKSGMQILVFQPRFQSNQSQTFQENEEDDGRTENPEGPDEGHQIPSAVLLAIGDGIAHNLTVEFPTHKERDGRSTQRHEDVGGDKVAEIEEIQSCNLIVVPDT